MLAGNTPPVASEGGAVRAEVELDLTDQLSHNERALLRDVVDRGLHHVDDLSRSLGLSHEGVRDVLREIIAKLARI